MMVCVLYSQRRLSSKSHEKGLDGLMSKDNNGYVPQNVRMTIRVEKTPD